MYDNSIKHKGAKALSVGAMESPSYEKQKKDEAVDFIKKIKMEKKQREEN